MSKRNMTACPITNKTIFHVDINSYFATLLEQENPAIRDKPIGVVKDAGRTCIIAASKTAKKYGVKTGSNVREARQLCPDILLIPATFDRYLDATKRLQRIFTALCPEVFIYSLDEAFLDFSHCRRYMYPPETFPTLQSIGHHIQEKIKEDLGSAVTSNVGIGPNRLLAKLASEIAPKGSVLQIHDQNMDSYLAEVEFDDVCGIGYRLAKKLLKIGVTHPYQIRFYTQEELTTYVGPYWARELLAIAYGEEPELLSRIDTPKKPHMQSVGRSITGFRTYHPTQDAEAIRSILYNLGAETIDKLRTMNLAGRKISLSLYGGRSNPGSMGWEHDHTHPAHQYWSTHCTLKTSINHIHTLQHHIAELYQKWPADFPIIKFAIRISLLSPHTQDQLLPQWQKQEHIQSALDSINKKYGLFKVRPATIKTEHLIRPEVTGFLGDRQYQLTIWNDYRTIHIAN